MRSASQLLRNLKLTGLILAGGCGPSVEGPNVLIAVFDACRPDKMGCYGFGRPTTPTIDEVAADPDSTLFERHYVQGTWTKTSTASLFTGLYLSQHQVFSQSYRQVKREWSAVLPDEFETLAEAYQAAGYYTFALTMNPHLDPVFGFDQGFDHYSTEGRHDLDVMQDAQRRLRKAGTPFFGYLHFIGCHYPYVSGFLDEEYFRAYQFDYDQEARAAAGVDFSNPAIWYAINKRGLELEPDDVRFLNLAYEARLLRVDRHVFAPLVRSLRDLELYNDTLLIFTADHGEELYEHDGYGHGHDLWEEVVHVPMVVKFPKGERPEELGARWTGLTRAIDVFPALASVTAIERPEGSSGRDIFSGARVGFALVNGRNRHDDWALVTDSEKVISRPGRAIFIPPTGQFLRFRDIELFDLVGDPGEARDLASERRGSVGDAHLAMRRFWERLRPRRRSHSAVETEPLSEEAVEQLRSLGYLE